MLGNKIKVGRLALIIVLIISIIFSNSYLYAREIVSMPKVINIYNKTISIPVRVYNAGNDIKLYDITLHTRPFQSKISPSRFRLYPKQEIILDFELNPLDNQLPSEYRSSLELSVNGLKKLILFNIVQNKNKICKVDVIPNINYDLNINRYLIELDLKNNASYSQVVNLESMDDVLGFKQISSTILPNKSKRIRYSIDTNKSLLKLDYICNTQQKTLSLKLPKKDINKKNNDVINKISGFLTMINLKVIYNSLIFQIFLLVILIGVILSFSTRYIKLINKKM